MRFLAILLFVPVLPLQLLGKMGTCTQNDTDPFLAGVVSSAPLALGSLILIVLAS